jgi:hypothetical protein
MTKHFNTVAPDEDRRTKKKEMFPIRISWCKLYNIQCHVAGLGFVLRGLKYV